MVKSPDPGEHMLDPCIPVMQTRQIQHWYWVASAFPVAATAYYLIRLLLCFRQLPAQVPVRFDFDGTPNEWMGRWLWLVLSPLILVATTALVFSTRPSRSGMPFTVSALMYWCACGLVTGAFLEILRAARKHDSLHFLFLGIWVLLIVAGESLVLDLSKCWWFV